MTQDNNRKSHAIYHLQKSKVATLEQVNNELDCDNKPSKYDGMWKFKPFSTRCWFHLATKHFESSAQAKAWAIKNNDIKRDIKMNQVQKSIFQEL